MALMALWIFFGAVSPGLGEGPEIIEDPENGRWEYHGTGLNIVIEKVSEKVKSGKKKKIREYCIADIQASPEQPLFPIMTEPTKKRPAAWVIFCSRPAG